MRKPSKLKFEGFTLVLLPDDCTREVKRLFRSDGMLAAEQRNGNVGVSRTGIFDHPNNPRSQLRAARCLRGLKLIGPEILAAYEERFTRQDRQTEVQRLRFEAEALGFKVPASWK